MRRIPQRAILAFLAVVSVPAAAAAQAPDAAPSAVVAEPTFDAGEVPVGQPIEAEFVIENRGDAPLEILRVQPGCGCTVAEYDETIPPGGTGRVRAVVDTVAELGQNTKVIDVVTNDPENPRIRLSVESKVRPYLVAEPGYARFTSFVHEDRDQSSPQVLWAKDFSELEITGIEAPAPWIEVSHREATPAERSEHGGGKQWRIDVTVSKTAPIGPMAEHVLVRTNHPRQKVVEIPVSGFVRPMVAVTPPDLNFGKVDPAEAQEWGILVRNFGSQPLQIERLDSTVPGMDVAIEPLREGHQYKLVFVPTAEMAKGPFQGQVALETNLPQQPKITVNLRGEIL